MSCNRFGFNTSNLSDVHKKYVDSKFITLSKDIQTKVDKIGDTLSGNLNMKNGKITGLADPISDEDACNKIFVDSKVKQESILAKLYIDTFLRTKRDKNITENLNMNGQQIIGLENTKSD